MSLHPNGPNRGQVAALRWFPGHPSSVGDVRRFIANRLQYCAEPDAAILVASELASNALQHTESGNWTTGFLVMLEHTAEGALITVHDAGSASHVPYIATPPLDTERGRGLHLVDRLTESWGSQGGPAERMTWGVVRCH
ncbi:ATP-binding protein [Streptomonospora nanhaiensis]|uniref:Anti-sigma regulatory factor (Ser/Thr protein kinase) n=1 Tax=Streptomonospora nanhaiensis TaxID=1323731 RepID=A0A853BJG3_9ACTN|nr:ATP-binding protein [Streptomonospora nanhaiensis]MBV2364653.1 ATP-binding protein [Streptomonospora nanhaiensis]MBX9390128.1 ATP-binding protein [Streptomonospora nanhaiensis]NYI94656.1 anti-sigma regulatory factor (Ser/Thr protein kinase) [Streptomonospora nanhaiensis]